MIHKTHVLLKQYGERGIILTKRNLSLSMKIVLLLLSSAILAILCYAFFRNNVTDFYTFIETVEKPFNEKTFIKGFKEEIEKIKTIPISEEELHNAKNNIIGKQQFITETNSQQSSLMAYYAISEKPFDYQKEVIEDIKKVTAKDLQDVANKYLNDNFVLAMVKPQV